MELGLAILVALNTKEMVNHLFQNLSFTVYRVSFQIHYPQWCLNPTHFFEISFILKCNFTVLLTQLSKSQPFVVLNKCNPIGTQLKSSEALMTYMQESYSGLCTMHLLKQRCMSSTLEITAAFYKMSV